MSYCHNYKDHLKNTHVTRNLHSILIYFILKDAIAHCYKQTDETTYKAVLWQKKSNLPRFEFGWYKICAYEVVLCLKVNAVSQFEFFRYSFIQADWVQSAANLLLGSWHWLLILFLHFRWMDWQLFLFVRRETWVLLNCFLSSQVKFVSM